MSTNRFSFQSEYISLDDDDYQDALHVALGRISKNKLEHILRELAENDTEMQFRLAARIVPMSMDDTVKLLQDARAHFQQENGSFSMKVQARLGMVTAALLCRAQDKLTAGELLSAACICIAVIRALEPMIAAAADDGKILRQLIADMFEVLRSLPLDADEKETLSFIILLASAQLNETIEQNRHYKKEWEELIGQYRQQIASLN